MAKRTYKPNNKRAIRFVVLGLLCLIVVVAILLQGTNIAILNPKGLIAREQRRLLIICVSLLLEIAIPTLTIFYFTAWKYRESNTNAGYNPKASHSKSVVFSIWAFPIITMLLISSVMWPAAHKLAPQKLIVPDTKPMTIQVIAMRWKWLFIYPDQDVASVNYVELPVGTPVQFEITADEMPMSSFWIPNLAGQLYAMTGHVNHLNILAEKPGDYPGSSAEINGDGFAGMKFVAHAAPYNDFSKWVQDVRQKSHTLDSESYAVLLKPSESNPASYYSHVEPDLYDTMLTKYMGSHDHHTEGQ